jgi:hypothetical protein
MPGRIIQSMKKAKTGNPLFLLDEIDKLGMDYRGDPSSALLEVLDPEQNVNFNDHYLEVDYDLSDVMFITTANSLNMPQPLLDRMEIIRLEGYTEDEKVEIAKRHLMPKIEESHSLKEGELKVEDSAIRDLIRYYTRESGVRSLERELARLARKAVRDTEPKKTTTVTVDAENLGKFAGVRKFRYGVATAIRSASPASPGRKRRRSRSRRGCLAAAADGHRQPSRGDEGVDPAAQSSRARCAVAPPPLFDTTTFTSAPEGATPQHARRRIAMTIKVTAHQQPGAQGRRQTGDQLRRPADRPQGETARGSRGGIAEADPGENGEGFAELPKM